MSKNKHRKKNGVHLNRSQRKKIRRILGEVLGDECCWCGQKMEIPEPGKNIKDYKNLATIEHHFAIKMGEPNNLMYLRLAHERCNK